MSELAGNSDMAEINAWESKIHLRVHAASHEIGSTITSLNGLGEYFNTLQERLDPERYATIETIQRALDASYGLVNSDPKTAWTQEVQRMGLVTGYITGQHMITEFDRDKFDGYVVENFKHLNNITEAQSDMLRTQLSITGREWYKDQSLYIDSHMTGSSAFTYTMQLDGSRELFWDSYGYTLGMACNYLWMVGIREQAAKARLNEPDVRVRLEETKKFLAVQDAISKLGNMTLLNWDDFRPFVDGTA